MRSDEMCFQDGENASHPRVLFPANAICIASGFSERDHRIAMKTIMTVALLAGVMALNESSVFAQGKAPDFLVQTFANNGTDEEWLVSNQTQKQEKLLLLARGPDLDRRLSFGVYECPNKLTLMVLQESRHDFHLYLVSTVDSRKWKVVSEYDPMTLSARALKDQKELQKGEDVGEVMWGNGLWSDNKLFSFEFSAVIEGTPGGNADCSVTVNISKPRSTDVDIGR